MGNAKWHKTAAAHFGGMLFPKSIFCVGNLGLEGFMSHFLWRVRGSISRFQYILMTILSIGWPENAN